MFNHSIPMKIGKIYLSTFINFNGELQYWLEEAEGCGEGMEMGEEELKDLLRDGYDDGYIFDVYNKELENLLYDWYKENH